MDEPIYTLHAGSHTYRGTAKELEAIRTMLKCEAREHWARWSDMDTPSRWDSGTYLPEVKSA